MNTLKYILNIILFTCLIYFIYINNKLLADLDSTVLTNKKKQETISKLQMNSFFQQESLREVIQNTDINIKDREVYWGTDTINKFSINLLATSPKLILFISNNTCSPCVEKIMNLLKKHFMNFTDNDKIIVATTNYQFRCRDNFFEGKKMLSISSSLGLMIEGKDLPFLFILDKDMKTKFCHIFLKTQPEFTDLYLSEINSIYKIN